MKQTDLSRAQSVAIARGLVAATAARSYSWVEELDNDSGTNITEGAVVVVVADGTIELAATVNEPRPTGVAVDDIDDGESGQVCFGGPVDLVQVVASVTAGTYGQTSTTPGQAQTAPGHATAFCEFTASGTTPSAFLWGGRGGGGLAIASNSGVYIEQLDTAETDTTLFLHPDGTGGVEWTADGGGGSETAFDHGNMGSTETVDIADGTWHRGTLNANCTITVSGFTVDEGLVCLFEVTQDGTGGWDITWDPDVTFVGDDQPDQTASSVTFFLLWSSAGDSTIYGVRIGAATVSALDDLTDVTLTSPAAADRLRFNGSVWVNSAAIWVPVMVEDGATGLWYVTVTGDGDAVMTEVS